jgi:hypothetical protein
MSSSSFTYPIVPCFHSSLNLPSRSTSLGIPTGQYEHLLAMGHYYLLSNRVVFVLWALDTGGWPGVRPRD